MLALLATLLLSAPCALGAPATSDAKKRIFIVDSYHRAYLWSQDTQDGVAAAMLKYGYLDTAAQGEALKRDDHVETSKAVIEKTWMNTKRRYGPDDLAAETMRIMSRLRAFKPSLVMLGDDNAANYIGNQLLDTGVPVVFWGINGLPLKYGLVDSMDSPGHNVTGVWQAGYFKESLELLQALVPTARNFAVIGSDSETTRSLVKLLKALARKGELPLHLADVVTTNSFNDFKRRTLAVEPLVDAFMVINHDTMKDADGEPVDMLTVGRWYLENIRKPEACPEAQFVREGMLVSATDSGFNQGYAAFEMAYDILEQGLNPARMRTRVPKRGPLMANAHRAAMLHISLDSRYGLVEQIVNGAVALEPFR